MFKTIPTMLIFNGLLLLASCGGPSQLDHSRDGEVIYDEGAEIKYGKGEVKFVTIGVDRDQESAIVKAKRNALEAVLFKGIPGSNLSKPIVSQQEREASQSYFNKFLEPGGGYLDYIIFSNFAPAHSIKLRGGYQVGLEIGINYSSLQNKLENDKVIKLGI